MDEEKLIELVKEHKVLFDPREKKYMDNSFKSVIWRDIASKCGLSSGDCAKESWKKLRDNYRCSIKRKRNFKSGSAATCTHAWKYETAMSFLMPFMKDRCKTNNSTEIAPKVEKEEKNVEIALEVCEPKIEETALPASNLQEMGNTVLRFPENEPRKKEERESEREAFKRKLIEPEDSLKLFFDSMYLITKSLPPYLQRKIKRGLFTLVSEAEEEEEAVSRHCSTDSS